MKQNKLIYSILMISLVTLVTHLSYANPSKDLNQPNPPISNQKIIAQSGTLQLNTPQLISALQRYRVWLHWSSSQPPNLDILKNFVSLRRISIQAIERMLIARASEKEHGLPSKQVLRQWILQSIPGRIRPQDQALDDFIRGRLALKANANLDLFWRGIQEMYLIDQMRDYLLQNLSETEAEAQWRKRGQLAHVWIAQIPRVPTHQEITQGIKTYQKEMKAYYQKNKGLFSQAEKLLVKPYWLSSGYTESYKPLAQNIAERAQKGEDIEELLNEFPQLRTGGTQTLPSHRFPSKVAIKEMVYSDVKQTRKGWTFYQVIRVYPGYTRQFTERSVQRELSASVLRQKDDLTHARSIADQTRALFIAGDEKAVIAWSKKNRVRFKKPNAFFQSANHMVPQVGTAPSLHNEIFTLSDQKTTRVHTVRQNYVIARLTKLAQRKESWQDVKTDFMKQLREELKPRILDDFLTKMIKDQPRWVSTSGLKSIDLKLLETNKDLMQKEKEIQQEKEAQESLKNPALPPPVQHPK